MEKATFAGGCFWCMEAPFAQLGGVCRTVVGYMGGEGADPTYEDHEARGFLEVVQITYTPSRVTYDGLLDVFWRQIDPTDAGGQFSDRGPGYRTAVFYHDERQRRLAEESRRRLAESGRFDAPIATEILPASEFYEAEGYHQDYFKEHPQFYKAYRSGSGRDAWLQKAWGSGASGRRPGDEELRRRLTPLQYAVTQACGTEPAFRNEYWANEEDGLYVDIVTGEPLFSSLDKYDSNTGWPSFMRPLAPRCVVERPEPEHPDATEVRSSFGDSHLGHVFDDGPPPTFRRYCINSAALRFIPASDLVKEGYGAYRKLFE